MTKSDPMWLNLPAARLLIATFGACAVLASGGCTNSKENQAAMDAITTQIQAILAKRPEVTQADVNYQNSLDASAQASANIFVKPGSDYSGVADETVRLLWTSKLNPLTSITIDVTDVKDSTRGKVERIIATSAQEVADLNSKYGQHPK